LSPVAGVVGAQLLEVITAGMYGDARMILREYVQNAVDSLDAAYEKGLIGPAEGRVEIDLDGKTRTITVQDNGLGVPNRKLGERLGSLGCSEKEGTGRRGFRGIGRLGGLAYCDEVEFVTRADGDPKIGVVVWDGLAIRELTKETKGRADLSGLVRRVAGMRLRKPSPSDPPRFFRVTLSEVRPFHADDLMNLHRVREYLSQVAPVPLDRGQFRFADRIEEWVRGIAGYRSYDLRVNGQRVYRPYRDEFPVNSARTERIDAVQPLDFEGADGRVMGRGWYAITSLSASLPPAVAARGIRVRQGNIEVGHEYFLEECFAERRFATWHIGEIHLDTCIRPNARRDGFEHSPDYERFLEQTRVLGAQLSALCRRSSKVRSTERTASARLLQLDRQISAMMFLDRRHLESFLVGLDASFAELSASIRPLGEESSLSGRLGQLREKAAHLRRNPVYLSDSLDHRRLRGLRPAELVVSRNSSVPQSALGAVSRALDIRKGTQGPRPLASWMPQISSGTLRGVQVGSYYIGQVPKRWTTTSSLI